MKLTKRDLWLAKRRAAWTTAAWYVTALIIAFGVTQATLTNGDPSAWAAFSIFVPLVSGVPAGIGTWGTGVYKLKHEAQWAYEDALDMHATDVLR